MTQPKNWPKKKYKVIYSDPPWSFKTRSDKGKDRSADKHYSCMSLDDICRLPVCDITDDSGCVLLLWTTAPFLQKSFKVIEAWGFTYKTVGFTWAKQNKVSPSFFIGMGYWTRSNAEFCLLCTRGSPKRAAKDVESLIISPRREHSRKPEIYDRIERLVKGPYLELFARTTSPGWDSWGNEINKF